MIGNWRQMVKAACNIRLLVTWNINIYQPVITEVAFLLASSFRIQFWIMLLLSSYAYKRPSEKTVVWWRWWWVRFTNPICLSTLTTTKCQCQCSGATFAADFTAKDEQQFCIFLRLFTSKLGWLGKWGLLTFVNDICASHETETEGLFFSWRCLHVCL